MTEIRIKRKRTGYATLLLIGLVAVSPGCKSLLNWTGQSENDVDLASTGSSQDRKKSAKQIKSERALCIETAESMTKAGHAREAILLYEKAESLDPNKSKLDSQLAALYASVGNYPKAISRYRNCVNKKSKPELIANYAWTLMEADQLDNAQNELREAIARHPKDEGLLTTMAVVEHRRGDSMAALAHFERVMDSASALHNLAVLDIDAGNPMQAKANLKKSIQLASKPNKMTVELLRQLEKYEAKEVRTAANQ